MEIWCQICGILKKYSYLCDVKLKTMKKLFIRMSILQLVMITIILPSSCTLPWVHEDDEYDITSKFKAVWNVHERFETNSDGSITYNSVRFGGLLSLIHI